MKRRGPQPLHDTIRELASVIAQPDASAAKKARAELMALFHRAQQAGTPDPFLTEAVADITSDPDEAVRLYQLSIEQCVGFPGEALHSKRCGLIEALVEMGHIADAQEVLAQAKLAAFAARNTEAIKELDVLAKQIVL